MSDAFASAAPSVGGRCKPCIGTDLCRDSRMPGCVEIAFWLRWVCHTSAVGLARS